MVFGLGVLWVCVIWGGSKVVCVGYLGLEKFCVVSSVFDFSWSLYF